MRLKDRIYDNIAYKWKLRCVINISQSTLANNKELAKA